MVKMRTISAYVKEQKAADKDTAITEHMIRQLVLTGAIPHVRSGAKYLLSSDVVDAYLSNGNILLTPTVNQQGIRQVKS